MKIRKVIFAILVIAWMIIVFLFSHQASEESSRTSGNTIRMIMNCIPGFQQMEETERQQWLEILDPIVRKLAHFSIYTLGGILIALYMHEQTLTENRKIVFSSLFGFFYAVSDEIHQFFVPRKSLYGNRRYHRYYWSDTRRDSGLYDYKKSGFDTCHALRAGETKET